MKTMTGFSLIELVIVIMLVAVLGSAAGIMIQQAAQASLKQAAKTDQGWQLRVAIERMSRDLTQIKSTAGLINEEDELTFINTSGVEVTYELDSTTPTMLVRKIKTDPAGGTIAYGLADHISSVHFYYYDANGQEIDSGTNPQNVRYILVRLTSESNDTETSVETLLAPRRLSD